MDQTFTSSQVGSLRWFSIRSWKIQFDTFTNLAEKLVMMATTDSSKKKVEPVMQN